MKVKLLSRVRLLATPMDCSLPGSSIHGIFQARVLEWGAIVAQSCLIPCDPMDYGILQARILEWYSFPFSRGSSRPRYPTWVSCIAGRFFPVGATRKAPFHVHAAAASLQSCPTLCDPMDCSLPGFSIHGILQARILESVTISFSRGSPQLRDRAQVSRIGGRHSNL